MLPSDLNSLSCFAHTRACVSRLSRVSNTVPANAKPRFSMRVCKHVPIISNKPRVGTCRHNELHETKRIDFGVSDDVIIVFRIPHRPRGHLGSVIYQIVELVTSGLYASDGNGSTSVTRHRPEVSVRQCRMVVRRELSENSVAVPVFVLADRELLGPRSFIRSVCELNVNFVGREIVSIEYSLSSRCQRGYSRVESAGPCFVILQPLKGCEFFEPPAASNQL